MFPLLLLLLTTSPVVRGADELRQLEHHINRRLLEGATCPDGCMEGYCQQAGTGRGLYCNRCENNLLANSRTGTCGCPKGTFATDQRRCEDCPKGHWCAGGVFTLSNPPPAVPCPSNLTTLGRRSTSVRSCINLPGYSYSMINGQPVATLCPENTYSPGLRKQRGCVPCPPGMGTAGEAGQHTPAACVVPAGFYLKSPGVVAVCPRGEWKAGVSAAGNCTRCPRGVTTLREGATSAEECTVVAPGYYASSFNADGSVSAVSACPQGFYCSPQTEPAQPGSAGKVACPDGTWTKGLAANSVEECLTPPGYYTTDGKTQPCPAGAFRPDWVPREQAPACSSCGEGVKSDKTDRITQILPDGTEVLLAVTSSPGDCYIQPGQGLYYETLTKKWRAKDCQSNSYGVGNVTYGLTPAPCRDCPAATVAVNSSAYNVSRQYYVINADGTGGFSSELACVTRPGYGMTGRGSQKCDQGYFNPGNNHAPCQPCGHGKTTVAPGAGITEADCVPTTGFGLFNGNIQLCPIGTYNDAVVAGGAATPCKPCASPGLTTQAAGSSSAADCQLCLPGWGGSGCSAKCGGEGVNATYGPAGRSVHSGPACLPCSTTQGNTVTFSFMWNMQNDMFSPGVVSRVGAASPVECLSSYSQIVDGNYYLPLSSDEGVTKRSNVRSFPACVDLCSAIKCQIVTYDYATQECFLRVSQGPVFEGAPWLALKVFASGYVGTSPSSLAENSAKTSSTGVYTFYQESQALAVGKQVPAPERGNFTSVQQCLTACDNAGTRCSGVTVLSTVAPLQIPKTCMLIQANTDPGLSRRSMIRADLDRLILPSAFLCPSGYTVDADKVMPCEPLTTPAVVYIFMRAQESCSPALIESVRSSFTAFLGDPNTAFGVYVPGVSVNVACFDVPELQGSGRRLQQIVDIPPEKFADLVVSVAYPGTTEGGKNVVAACSTGACTQNVTGVRFVAGEVVAGTKDDLKVPGTTLVQQQTLPGETYKFVASYQVDGSPAAALLTLTTAPPRVVACKATEQGKGVTAFECYPLEARSNVVFTANGPDPAVATNRIQASMTVPNITCLKGSVPENGTAKCQPCPAGTYAPALATECTPCQDGFTTPAAFSFSKAQCRLCRPGREGVNCTQCAVGRFSLGGIPGANLTCSRCPRGTTTLGPGASTCPICAHGYFSANGLPPGCTQCPATTTTAQVATPGTAFQDVCTVCDFGAYSSTGNATFVGSQDPENWKCDPCPSDSSPPQRGTAGGSDVCTVCAIGYYSPTGLTSCSICPYGVKTPDVATKGASAEEACTDPDCEPGYTGAACGECLPGYGYSPQVLLDETQMAQYNGVPPCLAAEPGTYSDGGSRTDSTGLFIPCPEGTDTLADAYGSYSVEACIMCAKGWYSATGEVPQDGSCTACPRNKTTSSSGTQSTDDTKCVCAAGYESDGNGGCRACGVGLWSSDEDSCKECPAGTTTLDIATASLDGCTVCASGSYSANGLASAAGTACTECPLGSTTPGPRTNGTSADACTVCLPGHAGSPGSCSPCPVGQFAPGGPANQTVCDRCPAGTATAGQGSGSCSVCAKGWYSVAGNVPAGGSCSECPAATTTTGTGTAGTSASACVCAAGYEGDGSGGCRACGVGFWSSENSACQECPAGKTTLASATGSSSAEAACTVCASGSYSADGLVPCTRCPAGSTTAGPRTNGTSADACTVCLPGHAGSPGSCSPCPVGQFAPGGPANQTVCDRCPAGTASAGQGSSNCSACPAGSWSHTGSPPCFDCPQGKTNNVSGTTAATAQAACTLCAVGYVSPDGLVPQDTDCDPCESGTFTVGPGTPGGQVGCTACPPATYSDSGLRPLDGESLGFCAGCPKGSTTPGPVTRGADATVCSVCVDADLYGYTGQAPECGECLPGYGYFEDSSVCDKAPRGYWSPGGPRGTNQEAAVFQLCPAGTTTSGAGGAKSEEECTVCDLGYYRSGATCVECGDGTTTFDYDAAECTTVDG